MKFVLCAFLLVSMMGCASAQVNQWATDAYFVELDKTRALVKANKIDRIEGNQNMLNTVRAYFPNDARLANHWIYATELATKREANEITQEKYMELTRVSWERYVDINNKIIQDQQAAIDQQRRSQFMGNFLGSMGNQMNRTYPQPVTCASTSMPGVVTTNCR